MNKDLQQKLERLRKDYEQVTGKRFNYFFCPILFVDEEVQLCKAHIVNRAFEGSPGHWTVQRADVDSFYGSVFESEFISVQYRHKWTIAEALTNKQFHRLLRPKILVDGQEIGYFVANGSIPENFTAVELVHDGKTHLIGLKIAPRDMSDMIDMHWEVIISKDIRMHALVSLIKSAHLTMFELFGYHYALSAGGIFVGQDILGKFFRQNRGKPKPQVLKEAPSFFEEFVHMVRPIERLDFDVHGTISDGKMLICREDDIPPWAFIVFIKTFDLLHAVMIPFLEQPDAAVKFYQFLSDSNEELRASFIRFDQDHWVLDSNILHLVWPKTGILYP